MPREALPEPLERLADQVGDFIAYWGFKRIHGRIWCHLYLAGGPVDAGWLIRRLQSSKAHVSTSLKELRRHRVIEECGISPRGTRLYRANPRLVDVVLNVLKAREQPLMMRLQSAAGDLAGLSPAAQRAVWIDPQRARQLVALVDTASTLLQRMLELQAVEVAALAAFNTDWVLDDPGPAH